MVLAADVCQAQVVEGDVPVENALGRVPGHILREFAHWLVRQTVYQALEDLGNPEEAPEARAWLVGEGLDLWLGLMDRPDTVDLAGPGDRDALVEQLLARVPAHQVQEVLGRRVSCKWCVHLQMVHGASPRRCRCGLGNWVLQGRAEEYALSTVQHDSKRLLMVCEDYRREEKHVTGLRRELGKRPRTLAGRV